MTTELGTALGEIHGTHFPHAVYVRQTWAGAWQSVTNLYANSVSWGSGSTIGEASLEREYGVGMPAGESVEAAYAPLDVLHWYVKVEIEQGDDDQGAPNATLTWYGVIVEDDQDRGGALSTDAGLVLSGNQMLRAVGLEYLLTKAVVNTSHYRRTQDSDTEFELRRPLTFNDEGIENRTDTAGSHGVFLFTDDIAEAGDNELWNTREIVRYLLEYYKPKDADGTPWLDFRLTAAALAALPDWDTPEIEAGGRNVFELLNELCDRRRNLSWKASVNASSEVIDVDVFTFNADVITLPSGNTHAANPNTIQLDFDRAVDVRATLTDSASHTVDQVIVRGGFKRSCFSLSETDDGTLEAGWDSADKTDYDTGPGDIGDVGFEELARRIAAYRSADRFERVYSYFRIPPGWDGEVGNGIGGTKNPVFPDDSIYGQERVYLPRWQFERYLPVGLVDTAPNDDAEKPVAPIALFRTEEGAGEDPDRYQHAEKVAYILSASDKAWAASLRMQDDAPGIILRVSGAPQHVLARLTFLPTVTDDVPELNWKTDLIVTVMARMDSRVEVPWPNVVGSGAGDVVRREYIDLGDEARLDYVVPGTVKGIDDGELQHVGAGEYIDSTNYIRDDRDAMRDVAMFASRWFGVPRQAFTFEIRQLTAVLEVGDLITSVGTEDTQEDVNSVVTRHTIDLRSGKTTYVTAFAELDFGELLVTT